MAYRERRIERQLDQGLARRVDVEFHERTDAGHADFCCHIRCRLHDGLCGLHDVFARSQNPEQILPPRHRSLWIQNHGAKGLSRTSQLFESVEASLAYFGSLLGIRVGISIKEGKKNREVLLDSGLRESAHALEAPATFHGAET